jgi:hypothetical protein
MENGPQVCELVESDPLGDNGKVGLGYKLLNKAKVCCCILVRCGEVNVTVLLRLSNDGVKHMFKNDMIKCGQNTGNHSYGVKKKTTNYSDPCHAHILYCNIISPETTSMGA